MSDSRDHILADIRRSLRRDEPLAPVLSRGLEARISERQAHPRPEIGIELLDRFSRKLEAAGASVVHVASAARVPKAIAGYLKQHQLPAKLVASSDPVVAALKWPRLLDVETRAASGDDAVSVTGALAAVAETGTLMLASGPQSPTTLNFLPDDHIVVLSAARVVAHLEDAWQQLRSELSEMPRTVNLISGPSKTADVEQTLHQGAHGPRRLHVVLFGKS